MSAVYYKGKRFQTLRALAQKLGVGYGIMQYRLTKMKGDVDAAVAYVLARAEKGPVADVQTIALEVLRKIGRPIRPIDLWRSDERLANAHRNSVNNALKRLLYKGAVERVGKFKFSAFSAEQITQRKRVHDSYKLIMSGSWGKLPRKKALRKAALNRGGMVV
jgi:hypothetical protein